MPTQAIYSVLIGKERIVSIVNSNGVGVDVPEADPTVGGTQKANNPDKGNRKVVLLFQVGSPILAEDQAILLKVKVPDGVIRGHLQRFSYDLANPPIDNPLDYIPVPKVFPQSTGALSVYAVAQTINPEPADQVIGVTVFIPSGDDAAYFFLELDWYHSINN